MHEFARNGCGDVRAALHGFGEAKKGCEDADKGPECEGWGHGWSGVKKYAA